MFNQKAVKKSEIYYLQDYNIYFLTYLQKYIYKTYH